MQVSPALAAFAADRSRQQRLTADALAMMARWRARADVAALEAVLAEAGREPCLKAERFRARLAPWLADHGWLAAFVTASLAAMRGDDFATPACRLQAGPLIDGLQLLGTGASAVTLSHLTSASLPAIPDRRIIFDGGCSLLQLVAGGPLVVQRFALIGERCRSEGPVTLAAVDALAVDCGAQSLRILSAPRDAVLLRVTCRDASASLAIDEYDADSGTLLRRGSGSAAISRMLSLLPLAANSAHPDMRETLTKLTRHADAQLRWQAARHLASRDAPAALAIVEQMAQSDPDATVRAAALAARAAIAAHLARSQPVAA